MYGWGTGYIWSASGTDPTNDGDDDYDVDWRVWRGGLPHVPPELLVFESPPPPDADINVYPDPNAPWGKNLTCPNTPTKHASSIQLWWPAGPIFQLAGDVICHITYKAVEIPNCVEDYQQG